MGTRLVPTLAALLVTACWLASFALLFCDTPWAWFGFGGAAITSFCMMDIWRDAYRSWVGTEATGEVQ
jgi:hypothetical protein